MTARVEVHDIRTYLLDAGWQRHAETWRAASIWSNADGREILVPASDDLADTELRIKEALAVLTEAEERPAAEIITDIVTPLSDIQWYRNPPDDGFTSLPAGLQTLQGARELIAVAARTVVHGTQPVIPRGIPGAAGELLQRIELGSSNPADGVFTVLIPLIVTAGAGDAGPPQTASGEVPLGRRVGQRLHAALIAAHAAATAAAERNDLTAFEQSVAAGVSANLCDALAALAGHGRGQPFEVAFRWGRGIAADVPAGAVRFPGEASAAFQAGAELLRELDAPLPGSDTATVVGLVDSLHGRSGRGDWRVNVHGDLTASGVVEGARTVRVLLGDLAAYDRAITAHRSSARVRARGELSGGGRQTELHVNDAEFDILEGDA